MREEELKFAVHAQFTLPDLDTVAAATGDGVTVTSNGRRRLTATYYDTSDARLARAGITLRYRTGEDTPPWHLKLPIGAGNGGSTVRQEIAVDGAPGTPPRELTRLVTAWVRTAPLEPVATLCTERDGYLLRGTDDAPLAELVDDTVTVFDGSVPDAAPGSDAEPPAERSRFREIEVELVDRGDDGPPPADLLPAVAAALTEAGAVPGGPTPKLVRALGPRATAPPNLPMAGELNRKARAADAIRYAFRRTAARLLEYDLRVRRDEPDAVHQARVCCRRLRSDLRTFGPLLDPEWVAPLDAELRWLAAALGGPRDAEVLRARLHATAEVDPIAPPDPASVAQLDAALADRQRAALDTLAAAYDSDRYPALLESLVEAVRAPEIIELGSQRAAWVLPPMVEVVWAKLVKRANRLWLDGLDDDWHAARIQAKRARYAAEAVAPVFGAEATRLAKACAAVQDVLGEHQDAAIAADQWRDLAIAHPGDTALALTAGRLIERERAAIRAARAEFAPVWARATRPALTRWLDR